VSTPADTPDLRELAIEAMTEVCYRGQELTEVHAAWLVDAALSAVLPEHHRQVAEKFAATFDRIARSTCESMISTPPEYRDEIIRHKGRQSAFERCAEIARDEVRHQSLTT
jgi:hypothetical protein